jgi:excisionase family DNA binding protein
MPCDRLLTVLEVQDRLRKGRGDVYALLKSGELPSVLIGPRSRRIRESDLDAFIAGLPNERPGEPVGGAP